MMRVRKLKHLEKPVVICKFTCRCPSDRMVLMSCYAKNLAGAFLAFREGNGDDCNGESDQSDCHDKQSI